MQQSMLTRADFWFSLRSDQPTVFLFLKSLDCHKVKNKNSSWEHNYCGLFFFTISGFFLSVRSRLQS